MAEAAARRVGLASARGTMAALVRAVCPTGEATDDVIEATVDEADALVAVLAPTMQRAVRGAALALEQGARLRAGKPFSALRCDQARQTLALWNRGWLRIPIRLLRDLAVVAYYEQPTVRAGVGYVPDPFIAQTAARRLELWSVDIAAHERLLRAPAPLRPPVEPNQDHARGSVRPGWELPTSLVECDVVIVGSGAGDGTVAAELAEAGLSVVVLEEGGHHPTESFTSSTTAALRRLYRDGGATATFGSGRTGALWGDGVVAQPMGRRPVPATTGFFEPSGPPRY